MSRVGMRIQLIHLQTVGNLSTELHTFLNHFKRISPEHITKRFRDKHWFPGTWSAYILKYIASLKGSKFHIKFIYQYLFTESKSHKVKKSLMISSFVTINFNFQLFAIKSTKLTSWRFLNQSEHTNFLLTRLIHLYLKHINLYVSILHLLSGQPQYTCTENVKSTAAIEAHLGGRGTVTWARPQESTTPIRLVKYPHLIYNVNYNLLLTKRTGEYWPWGRGRMERAQQGLYKNNWGPTFPSRTQATCSYSRLVSSLLYGTRAMLVLNLPAFENKQYTTYNRFHKNGPYTF